jgi:type IV pilus assembly protein PilB
MARRKPIGEILLNAGLINDTQLSAALSSQRTWGGKVGSTLVRMGFAKEDDILRCLSAQLHLPSVDFRKVTVSTRAVAAVPVRMAEKYTVMPVALKDEKGKKSVVLAMADPTNIDAINEIQFQAGIAVRPVVGTESSILGAIDRYYRNRVRTQAAPGVGPPTLSKMDENEEMVILSRGAEKSVIPTEGADVKELLEALIRVLEDKGVVSREDLTAALRRGS